MQHAGAIGLAEQVVAAERAELAWHAPPGNRALALLVQRGRIKTGGSPMELAVRWIVEVLDGQLARVDVHFSWESALEAAGLAE